MPQKRIDQILDILKTQGYVTVKYLCQELHYSTATINRDLNELQRQNKIVRHYGGAELVAQKGTPLHFRYHKMRPVKRLLSKLAAQQIREGMTVFVDGCTTTQYMAEYIKQIPGLTVITNNLNLASFLSEEGVGCIVLGGKIVEKPYMTGGADGALMAESYRADMAFFSTGGVTKEGVIGEYDNYYALHKAMLRNAAKRVFLVDSQKVGVIGNRILGDFSQVDTVISDFAFSEEVQARFPHTEFIHIDLSKTPK